MCVVDGMGEPGGTWGSLCELGGPSGARSKESRAPNVGTLFYFYIYLSCIYVGLRVSHRVHVGVSLQELVFFSYHMCASD